jgi:phospholipase/carboxylesterase
VIDADAGIRRSERIPQGNRSAKQGDDIMLNYEWISPRDEADGTVLVLLHGRGATERDMIGLAQALPSGAGVVAPRAPFEAAPWGYGPGWAWYRYLGDDRPEPESFERSQRELDTLLDALPETLPYAPRVVVVGGFSQGGTMALGNALRHPGRRTGVLNFSGFLPQHPSVDATPEAVRGTRFFWGHGTRDPNIPFSFAQRGRAALRAAGADLEIWDGAIGHWIEAAELAAAVAWLNALVAQPTTD